MDLHIDSVEVFIVNNNSLVKSQQHAIENEYTGNIFFISMPPEVRHNPEKLKKRLLMKQAIFKELVRFRDTLKEQAPHFNLNAFYHNIKNIKIEHRLDKRSRKIKEHTGVQGGYYAFLNKMIILNDEINLILPHELLHVATSFKDKNGFQHCGFHQSNIQKKSEIGRAINEGYTTLLSRRYFIPEGRNDYELYVEIMKIVEEEIGQETMEILYSEMNLQGLLQKAQEHGILDSFTTIIKLTDYLVGYYSEISNPLRDFSPNYENLTQEERINKYEQIKNQKLQVEELLMQSIGYLLTRIAKNKVSRKEISPEDEGKWADSRYETIKNQKSILSFSYLGLEQSFLVKKDENISGLVIN